MNLLSVLYEACCDFVENIQQQKAQRRLRRRELLRRVRPWLQVLEDRLVPANPPATDVWVGGFNSDWTNAGNWQATDANGVIIPGGCGPARNHRCDNTKTGIGLLGSGDRSQW
jgi:hypothetical protein